MDLSFWDALNDQERRKFLEFLLWHYRVVDAFWFIRCEEEFGQAVAEDLNERVWGKCGELGARRIKELFDTGDGLSGFVRALKFFPWCIIVGYPIKEGPDEVVITVDHCPAQEGRLRHGKGEYCCKAMHMAEFSDFARAVDPRIKVECLFAPPDPHPAETFCKWRFTLVSEQGAHTSQEPTK